MSGVFFIKTNKEALEEILEIAKSYNEVEFTETSFKNLQDAIMAGEIILLDKEATQIDVDNMVEELQNAIDNLEDAVTVEVNKTALSIAVEMAGNVTEEQLDKVVPAVVTEFNAALEEARVILANDNANQEEVDEAYDNLQAAINGLEEAEVVDKSLLEAMVNKVLGLEEDKYIASSWQAMLPELEAAQEVLGNEKATQAEVDEACDALTRAYLNLRLKPNKDLLADLINKANGLNSASYTTNTWAVVENEVIKAQAVLEDPEASVVEVKAAEKALTKALEGLELVKAGDTTASIKTGDNGLLGIFARLSMLSLAGLSLLRRKED